VSEDNKKVAVELFQVFERGQQVFVGASVLLFVLGGYAPHKLRREELVDVVVAAFEPLLGEHNERVHAIGTVINGQFHAGEEADAFLAGSPA
jgi:hypothetical protein